MAQITKLEFVTGYNWTTKSGGTATAATDWLDDGLEPGSEEPQQITFGDSTDGQDGVKVSGTVYVTGAVLPVAGTRTWIRYTVGGEKIVIGGAQGCRISLGEGGVRKLGEGPRYTTVMYSCAGDNKGDCIGVDNT